MNLYFESTAIVIYFIKLGRFIDGISKDKTREAMQKLVKITPSKATLKVGEVEKEVTIDEINVGDKVVAKPGEKIAVDGQIVFGRTHVDESFITGESRPSSKSVGDKVIAGSINYDGYIEYLAEKIGKKSTISEIVRLVVEASNTKAPISKIADKVSGFFVPAVFIIAFLTFITYLILGIKLEDALITFVTILVVACPCSLGLATPLAMVVAEGECARKGIAVKKNEILESTQKIDTAIFDKTGTLTYGKLRIAKTICYDEIESEKLLQIVGSIEAKSTHPISEAFTNYLDENKISKLEVNDFENIQGKGLSAKIDKDYYLIGNNKILLENGINNLHIDDEQRLSKSGCSVVYVSKNNNIIALIGVNDIIKEEAKEVIKWLNNNKIETIMLTGDNELTAKEIAKEVGISKVIADVLPQDKAKTVSELKQEKKKVLMCGDGINDSPALASADIGISIKGATDIAMDSADVILLNGNLLSILYLIQISKKTVLNIKQNLFWAFFYNMFMIPIAMGLFSKFGLIINPMIASFAMVLCSLTVILNTLRLKKVNL